MRRQLLALAGLLGASPLLAGCMSGLLYTHTVMPLTTNFDHTPVHMAKTDTAQGDIHHVSVPLTHATGDILWQSNAIGDIAKRENIEEVCYADLETLSIAFHIWSEYTVHIYGRPGPAAPK
jgi:hypothetical protein